MGIEITESRLIICEGKADVAFFDHLIQGRGLPGFQVLSAEGKDGYERVLVALSAAPGFDRIAGILVVGDNDLDPPAAFFNIQEQIRAVGTYPVPNHPGEAVKNQGYPAVVVMMVPWQERVGCLETLLIEAVDDVRHDLKLCVDTYAACAHADAWNEVEQSKMKLQSLISAICRSDPNTPVSFAWSRNEDIIPLDRPCFDQIANFLGGFDGLVA
jgi:hypothetical protein